MNILIDLLPSKVTVDDTEYEIRTDFRISVLFSLLMEDDTLTDEQKVIQALDLYYPVIPVNVDEAINKIIWFYCCGKENKSTNGNKGSNKKIFDFEEDSNYIYSAFMSQYRIDLQDIAQLHWWKFKALLEGLKDDNKLSKIIEYRSIDLNKIEDKEQKKYYRKLQKMYSLDKPSKVEQEELEKWKSK